MKILAFTLLFYDKPFLKLNVGDVLKYVTLRFLRFCQNYYVYSFPEINEVEYRTKPVIITHIFISRQHDIVKDVSNAKHF